ncbi:MAG: transcriptional regulator [Colwelliaceae bacterium]|nr:transcriptional regulator [Colwelliaceae bacterium]
MHYHFDDYTFDAAHLVLSKHGDSVDIRKNEALLLKLLLERAGTVVSKDDILSEVWQDRIVSEQAVFQNISHLRALFGNSAIKTFSKRGYQWQLPLTEVSPNSLTSDKGVEANANAQQVGKQLPTRPNPSSPSTIDSNTSTVNSITNAEQVSKWHWPIAALVPLVILVSILFNSKDEKHQGMPPLAMVPFIFSDAETESVENAELKTDEFPFELTMLSDIDPQHYAATKILSYQQISKDHPLILSGYFWRSATKAHLDFTLKGRFGEWQGQLSGQTAHQVMSKLAAHLRQPFIIDIVNKQTPPDVKLAQLSLAHQANANDLIVLQQLVSTYIELGQLDSAMSLADKLENAANNKQSAMQLGNALLLQSTILTRKEVYELSHHKLTLAKLAFEQISDDKRLADVYNAQSWLDYQAEDYPAIKKHLLLSAEHAVLARDIERELHALTYLSVLAHKLKQHDDKYLYLQRAESKMDSYQLPQYHYAKIPFHHAIYSDAPAQKEPHLKNVLIYTELTPDHWVAQSSRSQLLNYYINSNRLSLASDLVDPLTTSTPENTLLKARLAMVKNQQDDYQAYGKQAFEQAQLAGKGSLTLDIALLMCEVPNLNINYDFYLSYIEEHATLAWRQRNQQKLHALNVL